MKRVGSLQTAANHPALCQPLAEPRHRLFIPRHDAKVRRVHRRQRQTLPALRQQRAHLRFRQAHGEHGPAAFGLHEFGALCHQPQRILQREHPG